MTESTIRPSGHYATFEGVEYSAGAERQGNVVLTALGDGPPPAGFKRAKERGVAGKRTVPRGSLERFVDVETTCNWQGEGPFHVDAIKGTTLYLQYWGSNGKYISAQPFVVRAEHGLYDAMLDISEVENILENVTEK